MHDNLVVGDTYGCDMLPVLALYCWSSRGFSSPENLKYLLDISLILIFLVSSDNTTTCQHVCFMKEGITQLSYTSPDKRAQNIILILEMYFCNPYFATCTIQQSLDFNKLLMIQSFHCSSSRWALLNFLYRFSPWGMLGIQANRVRVFSAQQPSPSPGA